MESKLNYSFIQQYSEQFIRPVADEFFKKNEVVTGQQLLGFCPVKQVQLICGEKAF